MGSFLPSKDADLLGWAGAASAQLTATPTAFGLTVPDAASFKAAYDAFAAAMAVATNDTTRTKPALLTRDATRRALRVAAGFMSRKVQGTPSVTDAQKAGLGLNVRAAPQPIPAPATSPVVQILSVNQNVVQLKLTGVGTTKGGLPAGVSGAVLITHIGDTPPADPSQWVTQGVVGRGRTAIAFPLSAEPFSKVWISANWFSPSKKTGPLCSPVSTNLGSWLAADAPANAGTTQQLKAA